MFILIYLWDNVFVKTVGILYPQKHMCEVGSFKRGGGGVGVNHAIQPLPTYLVYVCGNIQDINLFIYIVDYCGCVHKMHEFISLYQWTCWSQVRQHSSTRKENIFLVWSYIFEMILSNL